jgi:transposase
MEYGAIDLHTRRSQIRILASDGTIVLDRRIDTTRRAFSGVFESRAPMQVLIESATESEWVAQHLESLGHQVIVADPNYAAMYGQRTRRIKTDRRDVAALAAACRLGHYRRAHRVSGASQTRRQQLRVREHAVRMRTQTINVLRAILRQRGLRLPSGTASTVDARVQRLTLDPTLQIVVTPLLDLLRGFARVITDAERWTKVTAAQDPVTQRLMTVPGVGPVIALSFQATLDTPTRFGGDASRASAYLGLVPREHSSGEHQRKGGITKAGPPVLRSLLVQAAWVIWRRPGIAGATLHAWALRLAARRGRRIAVVALARRLSRVLFALWRDETVFTVTVAA